MVDKLVKIIKTLGRQPKKFEKAVKAYILESPQSLHAPPQTFPNYILRVQEVNPFSGSFHRSIKDWARFGAFLEMNTPVFDPEIREASAKIVERLKLKEIKEKEESEAKHKKMKEDRAKSFYDIKIQWRSRHYFKDVYDKIRNLSPTQRESLEEQIRANEHPARYSPEDIDTLLIFLESLKK